MQWVCMSSKCCGESGVGKKIAAELDMVSVCDYYECKTELTYDWPFKV